MTNQRPPTPATVIPSSVLEQKRQERAWIALALANEDWQQTTACFALEGLSATAEDARRAGQLIAGTLTLEQALAQVPFYPREET